MNRNCWTCRHNSRMCECLLLMKAGGDPDALMDGVAEWIVANCDASKEMPEQDADGCPGYEPTSPQDRAQPSPRIETEANAFEPACVPWDADDDGRDIG